MANILHRIGAASEITADPARIELAEKIVLPGNGAFDACMRNLRASGLIPLLQRKVLQQGTPLLGICVGAQLLGHSSEEGSEAGLGWMDVRSVRFPVLPDLRVPHMGWNQVHRTNVAHPIVQGLEPEARFYFVHSYYLQPGNDADCVLRAHYGIDFAVGIAHRNIAGVQFHPEKSHRFGKQLLRSFAGGSF